MFLNKINYYDIYYYTIKIPKRTMKGHKEAISGVVWSDKIEIITSSWDHTIKIWDSELGGIKHELTGNKSFFDLDFSPLSHTIITASADRHIRLYDPRSTGFKIVFQIVFIVSCNEIIYTFFFLEGSLVKAIFTSHTQWVQSVRWSPIHENLFISGAYDNDMKLWDIRRFNNHNFTIFMKLCKDINISKKKFNFFL